MSNDQITPPARWHTWLESRVGAEAGLLMMQLPMLRLQAPRGSGPVMVLPGFMADDTSTWLLRRFLSAIGYDVAELSALLAETGAPRTGMCFDTGHAHMVADVADCIRAAGDQLVYVHLSDNSGQADEHKMPTCGSIDIDAMARSLRATPISRWMGRTLACPRFHASPMA